MFGYWILVLLLIALAVIDLRKASEGYAKDKNIGILALRGVLFAILGVLVINTVDVVLAAEFEIPYVESHQIVHRTRKFVRKHTPRALKITRHTPTSTAK